MGEVISFNGIRRNVSEQSSTPRNANKANGKEMQNRHNNGNQWTQMRLWAAVDSADSLESAARTLGGRRALLFALKAVSPGSGAPPPAMARRAA
jgi:hypothetical protein